MKILLVEDETTIAVTLGHDLADRGHEVQLVDDGADALQRLDRERYDCVISDLRLPGADGLRVLASARAARRDVGAILISAWLDPEDVRECRRLGARMVAKPFLNDQVVELVADLAPPPVRTGPGPSAGAP